VGVRQVKRLPEALARFIERRPWWFVVGAVVLIAAIAPGISILTTDTGFDALISSGSEIAQDNSRYEEQFGGESITVLLTGQVQEILSAHNLGILSQFKQEISGDNRYRAIISPLTLLQAAVEEADKAIQTLEEQIAIAQDEAAAQARQVAAEQGLSEIQQEAAAQQARAAVLQEFQSQLAQMQAVGEPSLDNPAFLAAVIYDTDGAISDIMNSLIPDDEHALVLVTPTGNMADSEALQAVKDIEGFFSSRPLSGVEVSVIADTKLVEAISNAMGQDMLLLLSLSVAAMVVILFIMFRVRWRLLSLLMVGVGALWTFGIMGYSSVPLTMATMAVLPILIGLGIDYSIQFHNRYQEELSRSRSVAESIITSISRMFPVVGIALLATIIGFITLYISPVPMVRDFGMMLAVGVALSYVAGLFLLYSIVYLADRKLPVSTLGKAATKASGRIERVLSIIARLAVLYPLPIFLISLAFAVAGGVVDQWLPTVTDYEEMMPQDLEELREVRKLREILGSEGEIYFMIEADNLTSAEVLNWLKEYQEESLALHPELLSTNSPATLVSNAAGGVIPPQVQIEGILENLPSFYLERVLSSDRQIASLSFGIQHMSLEDMYNLIMQLTDSAQPPAGVRISPVGTFALTAETIDAMVGARLTMNLLCLGAVFVVLLAVYRRISTAIFTVIPVGAVIAWSSLDMYLIGIPLNPLTAIMGIIIIGICTEFMVLLFGRYEEEKRQGQSPRDAMVTSISRIGRAIVTTAVTTLGGFGVLIASNFVMIRDFGIATVLGVFLCLLITITVMPGIIVWFDERVRRKA
jgi:hydrophobe/amphiphile efflux-3 (HAE3) family protein